jgi:hypothetical protein
MGTRTKSYRIAALIFLVLLLFSTDMLAQEITYISDILANPARYINMTVRLSGRVRASNPAGPAAPGSYTLVDDSFSEITVVTYNPPAPGAQVTIDAMIQIDPTTQMPYARELKVSGGLPVPIYAIIAAIVVLILFVVLVVILKKPSRAPQPTVATAGISRAKTERISTAEERGLADVGRVKTDKVPTKPAQLEVLSGDKAGQKILLVMDNVIGRDKGNVRFPSDRGVSGEHARIRYVGERYFISNVSLTNPTKVNDQAVTDEYELKEGDVILLGTVKARFDYVK